MTRASRGAPDRRWIERRGSRLRLLDLPLRCGHVGAQPCPQRAKDERVLGEERPGVAPFAPRDEHEDALGEDARRDRPAVERGHRVGLRGVELRLVARRGATGEAREGAGPRPLPLRRDRVGLVHVPLVERGVHRDEIAPRGLVVGHVDQLLRRRSGASRRAPPGRAGSSRGTESSAPRRDRLERARQPVHVEPLVRDRARAPRRRRGTSRRAPRSP